MMGKKMSPALKWAGGKTQLLEHIAENMPAEYNNYYEPFIGGAAVLFAISPKRAFINDVNEQKYSYAIGTMYSDFFDECETVGDYVLNVVEARLGVKKKD